MHKELLESLSVITEEEKNILAQANSGIDRSLYYREDNISRKNEIDASLLLARGKMIDMRPNTRFVHFPEHTHNFVEFVYMCCGSTTHIVDGQKLVLKEGDMLFMNQHARQEILPAAEHDIAVNFIILPQFFDNVVKNSGSEPSFLRNFMISCLTDKDMGGNYLYFEAAGILPVQNLMENLIWIMKHPSRDQRTLSQQTMALLFLYLTDHADRVQMPHNSFEQQIIIQLLDYIESEYKDASMSEFARRMHIDIYSLGRLIRKNTNSTFSDLLIRKRMQKAAYLLRNTDLSILDVSYLIGYENTSYFYRLFQKTYGMRPKEYRNK